MRRSRRWILAASNMLLGIALGLLSYYALTTLLGWVAQRELRDRSSNVVIFVADDPGGRLIEAGPTLDFDGWETEDKGHWQAQQAGAVFCRLVIPKMELDVLVMSGVTPSDLRSGPGWIDWSDLPGPTGTCGISGHRTTYGAPFRHLDELVEGDTIDLFSPYRRYRYRVTRSLVVRPDQVEVVAPTELPSLTLTACHPPYSARYRLAVQADLIEVRRIKDTN